MKKLYGLTTAMATPFDERGGVDEALLKREVDFLIERGVHCLYPCGTTGEMHLMSREQRMRVAEIVIKQAAGRVTVFIQVGAMDPDDTLFLARHARAAGADGVGVVTPVFFALKPAELEAYYIGIAHSLPDDFPVYLYNIPQRSGNDLRPETVARIASRCENVVGLKYSYPDMDRTDQYLHIREGFSVMQGCDRLMIPALAMGCDGTVSGISTVFPEPLAAAYAAYRAGDIAGARHLQNLANQLADALDAFGGMDAFKAAWLWRGLGQSHMHRPLLDMPAARQKELFSRLDALQEKLPAGLLRPVAGE